MSHTCQNGKLSGLVVWHLNEQNVDFFYVIKEGKLMDVNLPSKFIEVAQILEYLRTKKAE